jgi:broad specificity phosphatase PhoE
MMHQRWPERLWIVRHGESAGNVARDAAHAAGLGHIDIADRDVDVPLSSLGEEQSRVLGRWFSRLPASERPNVVLTSPYLRARHTAELIETEGGVCTEQHAFIVDEQ